MPTPKVRMGFLNERIGLGLSSRDRVGGTIKFWVAIAKMPSDLFTCYFRRICQI